MQKVLFAIPFRSKVANLAL